jgi:hypothetical protein
MGTNFPLSDSSSDSIQEEANLVLFAQRDRRLGLRLSSKLALAGPAAATAATALIGAGTA